MRSVARTRTRPGVAAGLAQLKGYNAGWFRADALAGITVTAYLVPQCLAYADLAGVEPVTGLWVAVVAMIAYALLGTSRQLSVGPESATAVMVAAAVAPLAAGDPQRYVALAAGLALLVGAICIAAFVLRLGFLADLLSQPILVGYMAGVALIMIGSQLATITGVTLTADGTIDKVVQLWGLSGEVEPAAVALGLGVTAFLLVLARLVPLAPGALIAVVGASAIAYVLDLSSHGVALVGAVPGGLPSVGLPAISVADAMALLGSAAAIAFVGYTDVALTGRAFAARTGEVIDANREFLALGVANVGSGLTSGFALSASGSRTAIIDAVRAHSQATGLIAAATVVVVVLLGPGLIALIPRAALGGIVVFAALRLIDVAAMRRMGRFRMSELGLALAAIVGVLLFGVLAGILIAIGLSVADLFVRIARPPASVLGIVPDVAGLHDVEDYPDAHQVPGLVVFRYDAPLCFANAEDFRLGALDAVDARTAGSSGSCSTPRPSSSSTSPPPTPCVTWSTSCTSAEVTFAMARVKQDLKAQLERVGLLAAIGQDRIYPTLPVALEAYERRRDAPASDGDRAADAADEPDG